MKTKYFMICIVVFLALLGLYQLVRMDSFLYSRPIAEITEVSNALTEKNKTDLSEPFIQSLKAKRLNGVSRGETLALSNESSRAQVFNENYRVGDQVFLKTDPAGKLIIAGLKRDASFVYIASLFAVSLVVFGGVKGAKSLFSVAANIGIYGVILFAYLKGTSLYLLAPIATLIFVPLSILIVAGFNRKALSAIIGTLAGTFIAIAIAVFVIWLTGAKGVHYEEMEFLTRSPIEIFIFGLLIGTLGAIMDIAISIASAVEEMVAANPHISTKELMRSGLTIGNDIVGTMANTLVFAYISGAIPTMLLYLFNGFSIKYLFEVTLSLDLIRAMVGSIGIVLSIPVSLFISTTLIQQGQRAAKEEV